MGLKKRMIQLPRGHNKGFNKEVQKQIVTMQKALGNVAFNIGKLETENRLIIPAKNKNLPGMQILVRDLVRQLISESGYELEFKVLSMKYPTKPSRKK